MTTSRIMIIVGAFALFVSSAAMACGDKPCGNGVSVDSVSKSGEIHDSLFAANPLPDVFESYLAIQRSLAKDSTEDVSSRAAEIASRTGEFVDSEEVVSVAYGAVFEAARTLEEAKDLTTSRAAFGELSEAMLAIESASGEVNVRVAYCPMAQKSWLQEDGLVANPYFGSKMLRCGSLVR